MLSEKKRIIEMVDMYSGIKKEDSGMIFKKKVTMEACPKCGDLGRIDKDQEEGKVSLICPGCGHHYYKKGEVN